MKKIMSLGVVAEKEIMTTVRLTTGGVCSFFGLDIDDSEDCKVCVTESLLLLKHAGFTEMNVLFGEENGTLRIAVTGIGEAKKASPMPEDEIAEVLLGALAENILMEKEEERVLSVSFDFAK